MGETRTVSVQLMHSQDRNLHRRIYGGHLMREAFELAYITAARFAGQVHRIASLEVSTPAYLSEGATNVFATLGCRCCKVVPRHYISRKQNHHGLPIQAAGCSQRLRAG